MSIVPRSFVRHEVDAAIELQPVAADSSNVVKGDLREVSHGGLSAIVSKPLPIASLWLLRIFKNGEVVHTERCVVRRSSETSPAQVALQFVAGAGLLPLLGISDTEPMMEDIAGLTERSDIDREDALQFAASLQSLGGRSAPAAPRSDAPGSGGSISFRQNAAVDIAHGTSITAVGSLTMNSARDCELDVGEHLAIASALVGGTAYVLRSAQISVVGDNTADVTTIALGRSPRIEHLIDQSSTLIERLEASVAALNEELETLQNTAEKSSTQREREMELPFTIEESRERITSLTQMRSTFSTRYANTGGCQLTVAEVLRKGTVVIARGEVATFKADVRGPLVVTADDEGSLLLRKGTGADEPVANYADVRPQPSQAAA